jgi:phage tail tape-measure protein
VTDLNFSVFWRDHGAQKGLQGLGKQAETTHGSFVKFTSRAGKGLAGVGAAAVSMGALGAVALAGVGAAGIGMGLDVAAGNEQAKISFTTMLGSAKKADKFLRNLQKFAATTPFEFPELQTAASSLISAGVEREQGHPDHATLGDVTSGMGTGSEGVKRATIALQQMNMAGQDQRRGSEPAPRRGHPGVSTCWRRQRASPRPRSLELAAKSGKLGKKELDQMMSALESGKGLERFAGLMDKQSQSLTGHRVDVQGHPRPRARER